MKTNSIHYGSLQFNMMLDVSLGHRPTLHDAYNFNSISCFPGKLNIV